MSEQTEPKFGDESACNQCHKPIRFTGKHWEHLGISPPRHMAAPLKADPPAPALESIDAHNARVRAERQAREERLRRTGVACPRCGQEMLWVSDIFVALLANPATGLRDAQCQACKKSVRLEV